MATLPTTKQEAQLWKENVPFVFGIDEAGRGCLAGPVCVGALALPQGKASEKLLPKGIRDSKQVSEEDRECLFNALLESPAVFGIGWATAKEVDRWNILRATYLASARAVEVALGRLRERGFAWKESDLAFLTDGSHPLLSNANGFLREPEYVAEFPLLKKLFESNIREKCVVQGDGSILSIAAASICAKVSRDRYMREIDCKYPAYAFAIHKGYGTEKHRENLIKAGPCAEHRFSYTPVADAARLWKA